MANLSMARYIPMATGNLFLGTGRGSVGDVTLYVSGGRQRSRVRRRQIANPRSEKQAIQRMVLSAAAKMTSAYEPIVNHSWASIQEGIKSVQHFRSLAMKALRTSAVNAINRVQNYTTGQFPIKGAPIVGSCEGIRVSSGSLGINGLVAVGSSSCRCVMGESFAATITTQAQYEAELRKLSLLPGDQLTLVVQTIDVNDVVASFTLDGGTVVNYADRVQFCRVVFKSQLPEGFSGGLLTQNAFNPALIEESQGILPNVSEVDVDGASFLEFNFEEIINDEIEMAGVIRSQKQLNGKFKYSNSYMKLSTVLDDNIAPDVFPSYMNGVGEVNVGDKLYLQHAVASPFGEGE